MSRFVDVPAARIAQLFDEINVGVRTRGGRVVRTIEGKEVVFDICLNNGTAVRTYSSLAVGKSQARDCGKDAVRIVVGRLLGSRFQPLRTSRKMLRTAPKASTEEERINMFADRLRSALREAWMDAANHPTCHKCSALMKVRKSARGSFMGCTAYPSCTGTRPMDQGNAGEDRQKVAS